MTTRRAFVSMLLLAALFNAMLALLAHEALHVRQAVDAAADVAAGDEEGHGPRAPGGHVDAACLWCAGLGHAAVAPQHAGPALPSACHLGVACSLQTTDSARPPLHWPFSSRDPPAGTV
ncbi:hypothetical protein V4F39_04905 [Aquincola sp. MAHUQ-54]|uniref:DUF2946 domain-containing protein n=1 Tax=Aquincola agrisoli TaxID=3119538 RepID=A0AAW9PZK2_9BURK